MNKIPSSYNFHPAYHYVPFFYHFRKNSSVSRESELSTMSDTEQAATAEEEGVTMVDVLEEEEALEDDAAAVLGNVSDTACSYSQGYLARQ